MIRRIAATDLEETLGVFRRACAASHPFLAPQFLCDSEAAMRDRTLLGWDTDVVEDGAIRGFLCRKETFIEALFIDPPFQSRGFGKCLLDHAKAQAPVLHLSAFAQNPRAVRFYQREGFAATAVRQHRETGETIILLRWAAQSAQRASAAPPSADSSSAR